MKFGLWLLIGLAAFLWFNHAKRQRLRQRTPPPASRTASRTAAAPDAEQIVACAQCGLHVPRSDALPAADGAALYCCEAHRRIHARA